MAIKLTEKQLEILIDALKNRIDELNGIITPLLTELTEHERFLSDYENKALTRKENPRFELLTWSQKIRQVLSEKRDFMTTREIVDEIFSRAPQLAEEKSSRSSIASILSRRNNIFKKINNKFGLAEWNEDLQKK